MASLSRSFLFIIILNVLCWRCGSVKYPESWLKFVGICINSFERSPNKMVSKFTTENCHGLLELYGQDLVASIPSVILWNPIIYPALASDRLKCPHCKANLRFWKWRDGKTERDMPRKLFCIQEQVLLVSCVYLCEDHHQILSHHPKILEEIRKISWPIPFLLFHKAGVTRELYNYIALSIQSGISIQDVENMLINLHQSQHSQRACTFFLAQSGYNSENDNNMSFHSLEINKDFIGRKLITRVFLRAFTESEHMYTNHMAQKQGRWISFDHTFKVAANIGYWRNGFCEKMYNSLFIIMNEHSDILGWQLTKGTALSKVVKLLEGLKRRLGDFGEHDQLEGIVVDNCCSLKKQISEIFGSDVPVKLDIFHAIQRVVKTIPKRGDNALIKQLRRRLIKDLRLCFRSSSDVGETRKEATPEKSVIEGNLLEFINKWKVEEVDNIKVLPQGAANAVDNLLPHVRSGCLSNIPPGIGTNRNERFHRSIRKWLGKSRVGVCLAVALLTTAFYIHMDRNASKHDRKKDRNDKKVTPIVQWYQKFLAGGGKESEERFGVGVHIDSMSKDIQEGSCEHLMHMDSMFMDTGCSDDSSDSSETVDHAAIFDDDDIKNVIAKAKVMANIATDTFSKNKAPVTANKNYWVHSPSVLLLFSNPS